VTYAVFLSNRNLFKIKRHSFIFIVNHKNPINGKIYICPLNNIHILFKDNFKNLINEVPLDYSNTRIIIFEFNTF